jgi:hypothetical protein
VTEPLKGVVLLVGKIRWTNCDSCFGNNTHFFADINEPLPECLDGSDRSLQIGRTSVEGSTQIPMCEIVPGRYEVIEIRREGFRQVSRKKLLELLCGGTL